MFALALRKYRYYMWIIYASWSCSNPRITYMSFRKKEISIQLIYGVADYFEIRIIYSFRKKEKKFHHHFKNFIVTSKVIEKSSKDASLVKAYYQSRAELFSGSTKEARSNGIKLNSSKFSNSSESGNFYYYLF